MVDNGDRGGEARDAMEAATREWLITSAEYLRLASAPLRARGNKASVLAEVGRDGSMLRFVSKRLQADRDVVEIAVRQNGMALAYAARSLQSDRQIVLSAVRNQGLALKYAPCFQEDVSMVLEAVAQTVDALGYASDALRYGGFEFYVKSRLAHQRAFILFLWASSRRQKALSRGALCALHRISNGGSEFCRQFNVEVAQYAGISCGSAFGLLSAVALKLGI